jgi:hypothetical protein
MVIDQLRRLYEAQPFRPFMMHLADGRQLPVVHREFLAISPSGRTFIVYQPDESFNIVDLFLVTDFEVKPEGGQKPNGRKKRRP